MTPSRASLSTSDWKSYNCFASALGSLLTTWRLPHVACSVDAGLDFYWARPDSTLADKVGVYPATVHPRIRDLLARLYEGAELAFCDHANERQFLEAITEQLPALAAVCNLACAHIPRRDALPPTEHYVLVEALDSDQVLFHDPFLGHRGSMPTSHWVAASVFRTFDGDDVVWRLASVRIDRCAAANGSGARALAAFTAEETARLPGDAVGPAGMRRFAEQVEECADPADLADVFQPLRYVQYQRLYFQRYLAELGDLAPSLREQLRSATDASRDASNGWLRIKTLAQYAAVTRRRDCLVTLAEQIRSAAALEEQLVATLDHARTCCKEIGHR